MHQVAFSTVLTVAMLCVAPAAAQERQAPDRIGAASDSAGAPSSLSRCDAWAGQPLVLAQGEVRVPSDAALERMQERAITTPPIDAGGTRGKPGSEEAEIQRMDQRDRRIDQELMNSGSICRDCK